MTGRGERFHGLDLARAVFMMLGVVYHSASVVRADADWLVNYTHRAGVFDAVAGLLHSFRMEAFFLLAGFFLALVIDKRGPMHSMGQRIVRLGVPLLFIGLTLNTLMHLLTPKVQVLPLLPYLLQGQWLGHLWFLANLLVYTLVFAGLVPVVARWAPRRAPAPVLYVVLALLLPLASAGLFYFGIRLLDEVHLFISFRPLWWHAPFFAAGILCFYLRDAFFALLRWPFMTASALLALLAFGLRYGTDGAAFHYALQLTLEAMIALHLALLCFGLFQRLAGESLWLRRMVDASYTIYLLHQPLIVGLFTLAASWQVPAGVFFVYLVVGAGALSYLLHWYLLAPRPRLLWLVNGSAVRRA